MFASRTFKIGDHVKGRKGTWAFEGEVADFTRKHIFILVDVEKGLYHRVLPHWITEIVDVPEKT